MTRTFGPQSLSHTQRLTIAHEIAERVKERFHPEVIAIGLYGSLAREEDGPYSDIELFGVLRTDQYEQRYEWCTAKWKAEVDLYGKQTLRERAAYVDGHSPTVRSKPSFLSTTPNTFLQRSAPSARPVLNRCFERPSKTCWWMMCSNVSAKSAMPRH